MTENGQDQRAQDESEQKGAQSESAQVRGARTKIRNSWIAIFEVLFGVCLGLAGFTFFFHHLEIPSLGLVFVAIAFQAVALRLILIGFQRPRRFANQICSLIVVLGVIACIVLYFFIEKSNKPLPEPPTFALTIGTAFITSDRNMPSFFWLVINRTAYAIYVVMHAEFTNLKQMSSSIRGYSVETEVDTNKWVVMQSVDVRAGRIVCIVKPDFKEGKTFNFPDNFNDRISNTIVPPGVPVVGWLFLSMPKEGWNKNRLRFRVVYSSAAEDVQPIIFDRAAFDTDFRDSEMMVVTNEDTSGLQFKHWEDRPAHFH